MYASMSECSAISSHVTFLALNSQVCELDLIFNFHKAYFVIDELFIAGELQETSKKNLLRVISLQDTMQVRFDPPLLIFGDGLRV